MMNKTTEDANLAVADDWASEDVPVILPKRLWDSLLDLYEVTVSLSEASSRTALRVVQGVRSGIQLPEEQLAVWEGILTGTLEDLGKEHEQVKSYRNLLKWVPPEEVELTH